MARNFNSFNTTEYQDASFQEFMRWQFAQRGPRPMRMPGMHGGNPGFIPPQFHPGVRAPRFPGPAPGYFPHVDVVHTAEQAKASIEQCKELAKCALDDRDYRTAAHYYDEALKVAKPLNDPREEAILLSNRSLAWSRCGDKELALEDAQSSIAVDPTYHKGYWREGQIYKGEGYFLQAFHSFLSALKTCSLTTQEKLDFVVEILQFHARVQGALDDLEALDLSAELWSRVVTKLSKQKLDKQKPTVWQTMRILVLGPDGLGGGLATGCQLQEHGCSLRTLLTSCSQSERTDWGIKLAMTLLRMGADWTSLYMRSDEGREIEAEPAFKSLLAALVVGLHAGSSLHSSFDLLKYLFQNHAKTKAEKNITDKEGNTLLHHVYRMDHKSHRPDTTETAIKLLLNSEVDPAIRNKAGKRAGDYLPQDHPLVRLVLPKPVLGKNESKQAQNKVPQSQVPGSRQGSAPGIRNLGPPPGLVPSTDTGTVHNEIMKLNAEGCRYSREKKYTEAVKCYKEAIKKFLDANMSSEEKSRIWNNLAEAHCQLDQFVEAERCAKKSIDFYPAWYKGHMRLGKIYERRGLRTTEPLDMALMCYLTACRLISSSSEGLSTKGERLFDVMRLSNQTSPQGCRELERFLRQIWIKADVWMEALRQLQKVDHWDGIRFIFGWELIEHSVRPEVDILPIMNCSSDNWRRHGEQIVLLYLAQGGRLQHGEGVLHLALKKGIATGSFLLLDQLLAKLAPRSSELNQKDEHGDTLLHIIAKNTGRLENEGAVWGQRFLSRGADPLITNKDSKLAIEYLKKSSPLYTKLETEMSKKEAGPVQMKNLLSGGRGWMEHGNLKQAVTWFTRVITMGETIRGGQARAARDDKEVLRLLTNAYNDRAQAYSKQGQLSAALQDAENCTGLAPDWYMGHARLGQILQKKKDTCNSDAVWKAWLKAYTCARSERETDQTQADTLKDLIKLTAKISSQGRTEVFNTLQQNPPGACLWNHVIEKLVQAEDMETVRFILSSYRDVDLSGVRFSPIMTCRQRTWRNMGEQIAIQYLEQGGNPQGLVNTKESIIHEALRKGALSDRYGLVKWLLEHAPSRDRVNVTDSQGNTLLHVLAQEVGKGNVQDKGIHLGKYLVEQGIDVNARNKAGKQADSLIKWQHHPLKKIIKTAREKLASTSSTAAAPRDQPKSIKSNSSRDQQTNGQTKQARGSTGTLASTCQSCEKRYKEAVKNLHDRSALNSLCFVLNQPHRSLTHQEITKKSLEQIVTIFSNIPFQTTPKCILQLPAEGLEAVVTSLLEKHNWDAVMLLLKGWSNLNPNRTDGPAGKISPNLALDSNLGMEELEILLKHGAPPGGLKGDPASPVTRAVEQHNYKAASLLLKYGATPSDICLEEGDTPMHAALHIALELEKGEFDILEAMFDAYEKQNQVGTCLDPNGMNSAGDTIFHVAAKAKYSKHALQAVRLLTEQNVNPYLRNKERKKVLECLPKDTDRRAQYIKMAEKKYLQSTHKTVEIRDSARKTKVAESSSSPDTSLHATEAEPQSPEGSHTKQKQILPVLSKEECRTEIESFIKLLPDFDYRLTNLETKNREARRMDERPERPRKDDVLGERPRAKDQGVGGEDPKAHDMALLLQEGTEQEEREIEINASVFDGLTWEVECTADVWKTLADRHVPLELKRWTIKKIQMLAGGEWRPSLRKKLEGVPSHIKLYEAKLTSAARILWEIAIAFSPRCSENAQQRLGLTGGEESAAKGGRIYSEIIRVWDIVLDHDNIHRSMERIVKSHNRGDTCIIQKNLKGIQTRDMQRNEVGVRVPLLFTEKDDEELAAAVKAELDGRKFVPPASANEKEYHIMKFFSFSSTMVSHILLNQDCKVDFPFRVTEKEHAIIHASSERPAPMVLLGRSGTGKTTCCLYRLWQAFISYWDKVDEDPWIPRNRPWVQEIPEEEGSSESESDEETGSSEEAEESTSCAVAPLASSCAGVQCQQEGKAEGSEDDARQGVQFDHLHQLFITKNAALCSEVQKNFQELSHASEAAKPHVDQESRKLPLCLQDAHPNAYPFFLTLRQLLLLLDASLPEPCFFERNEDKSVKREIEGWIEGDSHVTFIPDLDDESDYEDLEEEAGERDEQNEGQNQPVQRQLDPRREVTYEVFAHELWPRINKNAQVDYHPTLVWMEINSFIKGSVEALHTPNGYISKEVYEELGRKRAPNFTGDRNKVYELFERYCHLKSQRSLFDGADIVFQLYHRMRHCKSVEWIIHQMYVDETQDFTQAELCLLINCCSSPNHMFLTGDTAQSIMRGVAFRFKDLNSLFFYAQESMKSADKKLPPIEVPRPQQLVHNYRSHAGILKLAASVVDLLRKFFPESFDPLERDVGLFDGPRPVLLESCSFSDLAMLLYGSQRKTSEIEFGAHQAILVANDAARDALPEELNLALVLTIFEAKGLEFDDVLLYNFFKDSQANKEWRIVTDFLHELAEDPKNDVDSAILHTPGGPRRLKFDPNKHKVLNSELKHLYTALTRPRVNVWIFDEDMEAQAPVFQYFKALKLVQVVNTEEVHTAETGFSDKVFAQKSSAEEWRKRGDKLAKHHLYRVAAKCYHKSGDKDKEKLSLAHSTALEASRMRDNPRQMREQFLFASHKYLECGQSEEAAKCLRNAREHQLAALLYEKSGQLSLAAAMFQKMQKIPEASRCFETIGRYNRAVGLLCNYHMYDQAIDVVDRYNMTVRDYKQKNLPLPEQLKTNKPDNTQSLERLCYSAANEHYRNKRHKQMVATLDRLPNIQDRINFLSKKGLLELAAPLMEQTSKPVDIARLYRNGGKLVKAIEYAKKAKELTLFVDCILATARRLIYSEHTGVPKEQVVQYLREAIRNLRPDLQLHIRMGESKLLLAVLTEEESYLMEADRHFRIGNCEIGSIYVASKLFDKGNVSNLPLFLRAVKSAIELALLITDKASKKNTRDQRRIESCIEFYGLRKGDDYDRKVMDVHEGPRIIKLVHGQDIVDGDKVANAEASIAQHLMTLAARWISELRLKLEDDTEKLEQCPRYAAGFPCNRISECRAMHMPYQRDTYLNFVNSLAAYVALEDIVEHGLANIHKFVPQEARKRLEGMCIAQKLELGEKLYQALFSRGKHEYVATTTPKFTKELGEVVYGPSTGGHVENVLIELATKLHKESKELAINLHHKSKIPDTDAQVQVHHLGQLARCQSSSRIGEDFLYNDLVMTFVWSFYKKMDPEGGIADFCKYMAYISRQPSKPSLSCAMMLLEVNFMAFVGMTLCHDKPDTEPCYIAVIPSSYLAAVHLWDVLYGTGKGRTSLYNSIHRSRRGHLYGRIRFLVRLLCGEVSPYYNIIQQALDGKDEGVFETGEAERVLIMAMVLLCNCGKQGIIPFDCLQKLRLALARVSSENPSMPKRVQRALKDIQNARHRKDMVIALVTILCDREDEFLYKCTWKWGTGAYGINRETIGRAEFIEEYPFKILPCVTSTAEKPEAAAAAVDEIKLSSEEQSHSVLDNMMASEPWEEEDADFSEEIEQRFIDGGKDVDERQETDNVEDQAESELLDRYYVPAAELGRFAVDRTMCGVCNFSFQKQEIAAGDAAAVKEEADVVEGEENPDDPGEGWITSVAADEGNDPTRIASVHLNSPEHIRQLEAFQKYEEKFVNTWSPMLKKAKEFAEECRILSSRRTKHNKAEANVSSLRTGSLGYLELERMEGQQEKVWEKIRDIEKIHNWSKFWELDLTFQSFMTLYRDAQSVWQKERENLQAIQKPAEPDVTGAAGATWREENESPMEEDDDGMDEMVKVVEEPKSKPKGRRQKKNFKKKKR